VKRTIAAPAPLAVALGAALATLAAAVAAPETPVAFDPLTRGRTLTRQFFAGALDSLQGAFDPRMSQMMTPQQLQTFYDQVRAQLGTAGDLVEETVTPQDSMQVYTRVGSYPGSPQHIETVWAFDPRGKVAGFHVRPVREAAPSRFLEYETKAALRLPFDGEWFVFWGGRDKAENQHATTIDQRFALDLVVRKEGTTHTGDGKSNDQYHCWGATIRAPAAGIVFATTDGVDDNRPGAMNEHQPLGNHVILDHGNDEFSFLCHFRRGSVAVKPGQKVAAGDTLGACGNSGRSSEPHLHYHLQNKPEPFRGEGLPAQFRDYTADGTRIARGEPKRGQAIATAPGVKPKKKRAGGSKTKASGTGDGTRSGDAR
jgi:murein DD-endopeptidase MepM/ murein hydrolase activator NlpD